MSLNVIIMPKNRKAPRLKVVPEAPAKIMDGHVQDVGGNTKGRYRQTRSDSLRQYADAGQINEMQLRAARWYEERFQAIFASGRDSTNLDEISGGSGSRTPLSQYQAICLREIMAVDSRLSYENRRIIRGICGEGKQASECVREVTGQTEPHYPIPRFREALTRLDMAIGHARFDKWRISLQAVKS